MLNDNWTKKKKNMNVDVFIDVEYIVSAGRSPLKY